jgi:acetylglutamate kinase
MRLVLKLSGKVLDETRWRRSLAEQAADLGKRGHQLLLVHGGGKQLTRYCRGQDIPVVQRQGRRVTDAATLEAAKKVFGALNSELAATLLSAGVPAVGLTAFHGFLTRARRRPPLQLASPNGEDAERIDFGLVGEIDSVDPGLIESLWAADYVPVVSCLCCTPEGDILNINADTLAAELALSLRADRLVSLSDVDGIYLDPKDPATRLATLTVEQVREHMRQGVLLDGMIPKIQNAIRVLEQGVPAFQVLSGLAEDALLRGLEGGGGTLLVRSPTAQPVVSDQTFGLG